jgi:hypothetical protein
VQVQCQGPLSAYQHYFTDREQKIERETFIAEIRTWRERGWKRKGEREEGGREREREREGERERNFLVKILSRCKNFPRKIKTGTNEVT